MSNKLTESYSCKNYGTQLEDVDEKEGIVKGYFASFDTIDADDDVIRKGAFKKSIKEHGVESTSNRKIAHLRNHDWDRQIGKIIELYEDEKGLVFVSKLGRSTEGKDALLDYQDGILREHSIGFNYVADKVKFVEDSMYKKEGHYEITEVKLWEGSGVTFGSNSLTPVLEVSKSTGDINPVLEKIKSMEEAFLKALKNGKGTDDRLSTIEARFKQIQQLKDSLITEKSSIKETLEVKKSKQTEEEAKRELFLNLLK
jgi:HK97 family phage prohead protease